MAYNKNYQTVIAGRVREDETSFSGMNKVATPAGTFLTSRVDGDADKATPINADHMNTAQAGKIRTNVVGDNPVLSAYDAGSNNSTKY